EIPPIIAGIVQAKNIISSATVAERGAVIPLAESGMILGGEPHNRGGTTISADGVPIAIAERGELLTIVNKRSTAMLRNLSSFNQLGGGIPFFAQGGIIPKFQSGGSVGVSSISDSIAGKYAQMNLMLKYMKMIPAPVVGVRDI